MGLDETLEHGSHLGPGSGCLGSQDGSLCALEDALADGPAHDLVGPGGDGRGVGESGQVIGCGTS